MQKFITYDGLPLSSGGAHQINKYSTTEAYKMLQNFAIKLTDTNLPYETHLEFIKFSSNDKISLKLIWEATKTFGLPLWWLSNYTGKYTCAWKWIITPRQIEKALAFHERFPKLTFNALWRFKFIDPITKRVFPGQENPPMANGRELSSHIYLHCNLKKRVSVFFTVPFNELDSKNKGYIKLMQSYLPFTFSTKHWRLKKINNDRASSQKLDMNSIM